MRKREILVQADPAVAAAERIAAVVRRGGHIALAGGSTPRRAYELLAEMDLDWGETELWLGDERCVSPDHKDSNFLMLEQALVGRIPEELQPAELHRPPGELGPIRAAEAYDVELRVAFGASSAPPAFDLILLGLGPDAHTASLFPGDAALGEHGRWAAGIETPGMAPLVSRVSLTLPVLNAGHEVVFLISGSDKADAVSRAFGGPPGPDAPASLVRPEDGSLALLLDGQAAARLGPIA
jgi:6-phosphogluconolactonase